MPINVVYHFEVETIFYRQNVHNGLYNDKVENALYTQFKYHLIHLWMTTLTLVSKMKKKLTTTN